MNYAIPSKVLEEMYALSMHKLLWQTRNEQDCINVSSTNAKAERVNSNS